MSDGSDPENPKSMAPNKASSSFSFLKNPQPYDSTYKSIGMKDANKREFSFNSQNQYSSEMEKIERESSNSNSTLSMQNKNNSLFAKRREPLIKRPSQFAPNGDIDQISDSSESSY